jgi:hypothetical protein
MLTPRTRAPEEPTDRRPFFNDFGFIVSKLPFWIRSRRSLRPAIAYLSLLFRRSQIPNAKLDVATPFPQRAIVPSASVGQLMVHNENAIFIVEQATECGRCFSATEIAKRGVQLITNPSEFHQVIHDQIAKFFVYPPTNFFAVRHDFIAFLDSGGEPFLAFELDNGRHEPTNFLIVLRVSRQRTVPHFDGSGIPRRTVLSTFRKPASV